MMSEIEATWYNQPENVIALILDAVTGEAITNKADAARFYYVKGSEPTTKIYVSKSTP